jgi:hypothetical protein
MNAMNGHEFCKDLGGRLAEPQASDMSTALTEFSNRYMWGNEIWLGFNDISVEGR